MGLSSRRNMATTPEDGQNWHTRITRFRRRTIKKKGKALIRGLANFLGRQSLVGDQPIIDHKQFPALQAFEERWQDIHAELRDILLHRNAIPLFQEVSPDQKRIAQGQNWRTFILYGFGARLDKNCARAPVTAALLADVPHLQSAWFSIIAPGYHIPAHRGVTKGILRAHLGLIVPKDAEKCWMRVDREIMVWRQGKLFVFDDTYEHEVANNTSEERVILLIDFDRPMRLPGRMISSIFLNLMKLTAYYQEPKRNLATFEERFEASARRMNENIEKMTG
jgi:ornithine lipid ester-linked acyl 2-hydroxylase